VAGANRQEEASMTDDAVTASLRIRVGSEDAHYGSIAPGAYVMKIFGDLATEITVRRDGDEGLLRAYENVEFLAPVRPGDFLECRATMVREGTTSRTFEAEAWRVIDARPDLEESAVDFLDEPVLVAKAIGTTVVQAHLKRRD
jgi:3-aminobutyryl-CoA ammonia-lyase